MMTQGIVFASLTISFWILIQIFVFQWVKTVSRLRLMVWLYIPSLILYGFLQFLFPQHVLRGFDFLNGLLVHIILFFAYLELYYAVDRAVTLRLLEEFLEDSKGVTKSFEEIKEQYSLQEMIEERLKALLQNGRILRKGNRFFLTKKGAWLARFFSWGSKLYGKR